MTSGITTQSMSIFPWLRLSLTAKNGPIKRTIQKSLMTGHFTRQMTSPPKSPLEHAGKVDELCPFLLLRLHWLPPPSRNSQSFFQFPWFLTKKLPFQAGVSTPGIWGFRKVAKPDFCFLEFSYYSKHLWIWKAIYGAAIETSPTPYK